MERRSQARGTLRGVRVFLVTMTEHEPLAIMLRALGADVRVFASLHEADVGTVPTGTTVLVARLALADHEHEVAPVTFVMRTFEVPGVLRPAPLKPSFADRFVEMHRGHLETSLLCASIIRAAGLSRDRVPRHQPERSSPGLRIAM